ncbi:MAG TPA: recombinase family protein [Candidatus Saccharimonadales bacterium]|nr:recombinase family protein [Candidatus Saccharimonadales bacterium]
MNAILYIRVSTLDQAIRGDQPEGFSIPAQREACKRKAKSLKSTVIDEYVDRGESARSADRPELQRLLNDLRDRKKEIDYIIVHKVDRLARSLHDDVMIGLAIQKAGAQLVSVTENIDETPSGKLLHGIMATIAEFYSRNLAAEALKGATQKAKRGGTPYRAPLGYINVSRQINEREARTVVIDIERSALITWAFKRYATGDHSVKTITEELYKRGFRNRRTGTSMSKPIGRSGIAKMLHNRYYAGYVKYCGIEYRGRHKPLVSAAVFANVQAMSDSRRAGIRKRAHDHYLLGTLFCGQCGRRMSFTLTINRYKNAYPYFYCLSRQQGQQCTQLYIPAALVEEAVAKQFSNTKLTSADRAALQREVRAQLRYEVTNGKAELTRQEKRLSRLIMERQRILQAFYDDEISSEMLGIEQKRVNKEIGLLKEVVSDATRARAFAKRSYQAAVNLASTLNLEKAYLNAHPLLRRCLNQALFNKVRIDDTNAVTVIGNFGPTKVHDVRVLGVELQPKIDHPRLAQAVIGLTMDKTDLLEI